MSASASSGVVVALLDLERDFVGAAVLRAAQRADRAGDRRVHVGAGAGDHAAVKVDALNSCSAYRISEVCIARTHDVGRLLAVQQVQEVAADRVVVGLDVDALAVVAKWYQYSSIEPSEAIRRSAMSRAPGDVVVVLLRQHAAEHRHAGAHHVHRVRRRRQRFERRLAPLAAGRAAPSAWPCTPSSSARVRQLAVHQQIGDLLELAGARRRRGCRSRGSAGRCRCGRRCTARCCRR